MEGRVLRFEAPHRADEFADRFPGEHALLFAQRVFEHSKSSGRHP